MLILTPTSIAALKLVLFSRYLNLVSKQIAMHKLLNISQSKGNQTMKFGQLENMTLETFFLKYLLEILWKNYSQTLF